MRVLICDDREDECRSAQEALKKGAPQSVRSDLLYDYKLAETLKTFFNDVNRVLDQASNSKTLTSVFDGYDLVFIDNALSYLGLPGPRLTAEHIAGYVRAFSACPYVVSLNKHDDRDFDLDYLIGDRTTRADLAVNTDHLENKALWTGKSIDAKEGFLPWYWPELLKSPAVRRKQIEFVKKHLEDPVLHSLGFSPESIGRLSSHALGVLSPHASLNVAEADKGQRAEDVTFRDFFGVHERTLPARADRKTVEDKQLLDAIARTAAADIDLWFRRDIVGPQDILVDIPHLISRMPFLLGPHASDINAWNKAVQSTAQPFGCTPSLFRKHIKDRRYIRPPWSTRASFWWNDLKADEDLNKLYYSGGSSWGDFVFCEDTSQFLPRTNAHDEERVVEFPTALEGAWARRYIASLDHIRYQPLSRLAM